MTMPSIQNMAPPMKPPGSESFSPEAKSKCGKAGNPTPFVPILRALTIEKCHLRLELSSMDKVA